MFLQGAAIWHPRCGPAPRDPAADPDDPATDRASADLQVPTTSHYTDTNLICFFHIHTSLFTFLISNILLHQL